MGTSKVYGTWTCTLHAHAHDTLTGWMFYSGRLNIIVLRKLDFQTDGMLAYIFRSIKYDESS